MTEAWLVTDERADILASLSMCQICLAKCTVDRGLWKWAVLALHNALQGAMVCHLSGTANIGALSQKTAVKQLEWHERDRAGQLTRLFAGYDERRIPCYRLDQASRPPKERIADAKDLFERLGDEVRRCEGGAGAILAITPEESRAFEMLHSLRNKFAHFQPMGWRVEISGLPVAFRNVLMLMRKIESDPWPFRHMTDAEAKTLERLLSQLEEQTENMMKTA